MAVKRKTGKSETPAPISEPIETSGVEVIGEATNGLSSASKASIPLSSSQSSRA